MTREGTKEAAEAVLRELPSVIGACVREDVNGHPREVHLLVRAGPNPRLLAYDVRNLLEERLGVKVDQRVISIAQLAQGRRPGPILARASGMDGGAPSAVADAETRVDEPSSVTAAAISMEPDPPEPRLRFAGLSTEAMDSHVRVQITLELDEDTRTGEAVGLDTAAARLRSAATAVLHAVNATCVGRARFEVEHTAVFGAFEQEYVLVTVTASSPYLGRRPIALVGAQPVEMDAESAAALAALKAINRTLSLILRLPDSGPARPRPALRRN
jgi:hypothetical protein